MSGAATIDIIEAAKADRSRLDIARAKIEEHERQIELLQSEILQHEGDKISLEKWVDMYHELAGDDDVSFPPEEINVEPNADGAEERETPSEEISVSAPEIPADEPAKAPTKYDKVFEVVRLNPTATNGEIAKLAGVTKSTASVYASKARKALGIPYPSAGGQKATPAPKAPAKPEPRPTLPNEPVRNVKRIPPHQPKGTRFRLRNSEGLFLHSDLNAMLRKGLRFVDRRGYPWEGSERQMLAVRQMLPATIDLREEVITNG